MPKLLTDTKKREIIKDLKTYHLNISKVSRDHPTVSYNSIVHLSDIALEEMRRDYREEGAIGHKNEPYQTEEQMLSSPYYGATNKEKIRTINPDWKLINYEDEQKRN